MMSLDPGNTISLSLSPVHYPKVRQIFKFLANFLIQWKKAPASNQDVLKCFVFEASKAKGRSCTTRALLLVVP